MAKVFYKNKNQNCEVEDGESLKNAIQDNSWDVPFGCEEGVCGTCLIRITKGFENLNEATKKEEITLGAMGLDQSNHRLACQCRVLKGEVEFEAF